MFLLALALAFVPVGLILRSSQDEVLREFGAYCYVFAVVMALVASSVGCTNPVSGPSCKWVTQERIEAKWLQEINGRTFYVVAYAPKTQIEVCE